MLAEQNVFKVYAKKHITALFSDSLTLHPDLQVGAPPTHS